MLNDLLKKGAGFIASPSHSRTMGILVMLVLVSAVSLTVIVTQQQQTIRQRASGSDCNPPYEGYLGCFATDNLPSGSTCTGSCITDDGSSGSDCYTSTKVGNPCTTDSEQTGTCDIYGDCNVPSSNNPNLYPCNDGIVCQGACTTSDPNRCYFSNGRQSNCEYTTYNKGPDQCIPTAAGDQPCTVECSAGKVCSLGTCVDSTLTNPLPNPTTDTCIPAGGQCILMGPCVPPAVQNTSYSCGNNSNGSVCCMTSFFTPTPPSDNPSPTPAQSTPTPTIISAIPTITHSPDISPSPTTSLAPTPSCSLHNKGDANCDGIIDMVDFGIWQNEMMRAILGTLFQPMSDFNDDGKVDIADFNIWNNSRLLNL